MKRIETQEQKDKRKKRNQIIIGIVMVALLVFSYAGFALMSKVGNDTTQVQKKEINGLSFQKNDNMWITEINGKKHAFFFLPDELSDVEIEITKTVTDYINVPLYIVHSSSPIQQLQFNLYPEYILRINNACIENEKCDDETYPVKNCTENNIIIFQTSEDNKTTITEKDDCIYIKGDLTKGTDKFIQKILGII